MRKRSKIDEVKEIIKDLSSIIAACDNAMHNCTTQSEYEDIKQEYEITFKERERLYKQLDGLRNF